MVPAVFGSPGARAFVIGIFPIPIAIMATFSLMGFSV